MTTKTIGALLAMAACGATLGIASCESGGTDPESGPRTAGGSKSPDLLTDCASIFTGIENCTIGTADLVADAAAGTVVVTDFDADGNDGISGSFADAMEWSQSATADFGTRTGAGLHLAAISDGQAISELDISRVDATTFHYTPTFTAGNGGSSGFHVHVYNNGVLVGGEEGIDPGTIVAIVGSGDDDRDGGDRKFKRRRPHQRTDEGNGGFRKGIAHQGVADEWEVSGACEWSYTTTEPGATISVRLPNGTIIDGDEVLFTEEVEAGQAVYNDFQRIDVTGNLDSYTITAESTVPAE